MSWILFTDVNECGKIFEENEWKKVELNKILE